MTQEWFDKVGYSGLGWRTSKEATYDIAMLALQRGIPGDFVECGVYAGASSALMARALIEHARATCEPPLIPKITRRVHLFDSFQGTPEPTPEDIGITAAGGAACPLEDVKKNMERWGIPEELLVYHLGWFEDAIPSALAHRMITNIAVLRLDGDLYTSTQTCMRHLFPLVSPGGWVIVDDFDLPGCRQAIFEHVAPAPIYFRIPERTA
jgi:hypothetical protein